MSKAYDVLMVEAGRMNKPQTTAIWNYADELRERLRALAAELAESTRHRDQNRETAVALQMRVSALEAALREIAEMGWHPQNGHILIAQRALGTASEMPAKYGTCPLCTGQGGAHFPTCEYSPAETRDGTDDPEDCPNCGGIRGTHRGDCPTLETKDEAARRVLSHPKFAKAQCEVSTNNGDSCSLPAGHPGAHQI